MDEIDIYKRSKKPLIIFICLVLIAVISTTGYLLYVSNSRIIIGNSINKILAKLPKYSHDLNTDKGIINENEIKVFITNQVIGKNDLSDEQNIINQILSMLGNIKMTSTLSLHQNKMFFNIVPNINGQDLYNNTYYTNGKKNYVLFNNVIDKYVELENSDEEYSFIDLSNKEEQNHILKTIINSLNKNLDKKYISKSTKEFNDKNLNVTSITMSEKDIIDYFKKIIKDIKDDEKISKMFDLSYNFDNVKPDANTKYTYNVYSSKIFNNIVAYELVSEYVVDSKKETSKITYDYNTIKFYDNDKLVSKIDIYTNGTTTSFEITANKKELGKIEYTTIKNGCNIKLELAVDELSIEGSITYNSKEKQKKTEYYETIKSDLELTIGKNLVYNVKVDISNTLKSGNKTNINVNEAILEKDLTEDQINKINLNILESLVNVFNNINDENFSA